MSQRFPEQWTVKSYIVDGAQAGQPVFVMEHKYALERDTHGGYTVTETACSKFVPEDEWDAVMRRMEERCAQIIASLSADALCTEKAPGAVPLGELLREHDS